MAASLRKGRNSREKILDAASELVAEVGAGRLTLDAVALRAGLSKGGLLYNFPSKEALLKGMIERLIDHVLSEKDKLRAAMVGQRNLEARASIAASLNIRHHKINDVTTGLLAATAENPQLLEPARDVIAREWQQLTSTAEDKSASMLAWLAIEGLGSLEMHRLSPVSARQRAEILKAVAQLLDKGLAE